MEPPLAYAHERNPVEPLWASLKDVDLADLAGESLDDVIATAERGIHRIRHTTICPSRPGATAACPMVNDQVIAERRSYREGGAAATPALRDQRAVSNAWICLVSSATCSVRSLS
jgi:hypothetical protein